jgi:hypothetical protein
MRVFSVAASERIAVAITISVFFWGAMALVQRLTWKNTYAAD